MKSKRTKCEVAMIFREYEEEFRRENKLCSVQEKAFSDIMKCRTAQAGGHLNRCDHCGHEQQAYNSCRNRNCPKCLSLKQEQWVDKLQGHLLPTRYFHLVFTIPHHLNQLFYINQEICYALLFRAAWQALNQGCRNPEFLGAETGAVAVLHTWSQTLIFHPHIHMIVPGGGLSEDNMEWIPSRKKYLVPVKALSPMFRGILWQLIREHIEAGKLKIPDGFPDILSLKRELYAKRWNVHAEPAFKGVVGVLKYLGRYTHRVAISNYRILSMDNGEVTFRYHDKDRKRNLIMTIKATEFIRRFMQHVLPSGFYKIRYYGILASVNVKKRLEDAFSLVFGNVMLPSLEGLNALEVLRILTGIDPFVCPICQKGRMVTVGKIP